jgi:hypothetical protein
LSATSLSTPVGARILVEQREAEGERILARGLRELVHHRLHHVRGVGVADRTPPQRGTGSTGECSWPSIIGSS